MTLTSRAATWRAAVLAAASLVESPTAVWRTPKAVQTTLSEAANAPAWEDLELSGRI